MLALSLWQPHATAIALGLKKVETRGPNMRTNERGLIAIHAAKKWDRGLVGDTIDLIRRGVDLPRPTKGLAAAPFFRKLERWLPLGCVVAVATLVDCRRMDEAWIAEQTELERLLGGWAPGRWGWVLEGVRALAEPYPLKGQQGLWRVSEREGRDLRELAGIPPGFLTVHLGPSV